LLFRLVLKKSDIL